MTRSYRLAVGLVLAFAGLFAARGFSQPVPRDLEVFRRVYEILGMGWVYAATRVPVLGTIADKFYQIWAKLRLQLTGRPDLETIIAQREERLAQSSAARCR
ncbi:MAG: hypothetical protein F6K03_13000 [Kamptonema sp. SIO4C4]|nr:hypothetical protein [Kamptonema sp. SIO4C4]